MKCPNDHTTLIVREYGDIEVDYCPECHGAWLDRENLDKLGEDGSAEAQSEQHFQQGQTAPEGSMPSYDRKTHDYPAQDYRQ